MLNKTPRLPGEAKLRYLDATYNIEVKGEFVICAVTGQKIPLNELRYWSIDKQEPSVDAVAANKGMIGSSDDTAES